MKFVDTRPSLLARVRDINDCKAWEEFVELYAPLVYAYAIRFGLQDADAADITQEAMLKLMRALQSFEYDRSRGTFRGWLVTVLRNHVHKHLGLQSRQLACVGDNGALNNLTQVVDQAAEEAWERQCKLSEFHWAAERVRIEFQESTWQAFWLTTVDGQEIRLVAQQLEMTAGAVYVARSRVLARIREQLANAESEWKPQ